MLYIQLNGHDRISKLQLINIILVNYVQPYEKKLLK